MDCFSPGQNSISGVVIVYASTDSMFHNIIVFIIIYIHLTSDLQGLIDSDEASPESNYYPFTSRIQALLYMLIHSPHPIVS